MEKIFKINALIFIALVIGLVACSENEPFDATPLAATGQTGGAGGSDGGDSQAGSSGTGGTSSDGGTTDAGSDGDSDSGGAAGASGTGGAAGSAGTGGAAGTGGSSGTGGASGTGGTAGTGGNPNVCTPVTKAPCAITTTCMGDAECLADGSGYGICQLRAEICGNSVDDDCDGQVDENCGSSSGSLGCTTGQFGRTVRVRYTMPNEIMAKQLSVFDETDGANGNPLPRPVACGGTYYEMYYAWATSFDCGCADVCYVSGTSSIDCLFHRPAGSTIRANVDIWFTQATARVWSCATAENAVIGSVEFWLDGQSVTPGYELWPQPGKAPACRFILHL